MKLKLRDKEYEIKFGYRATVESGLLNQLAQMSNMKDGETNVMESAEKMMMWLPEFVLVGLQKFHKEEFGCNWSDKKDREEKTDKVFDMLDDYFDKEDSDFMKLFADLQEELMKNGFLSKMFQKEQEKIEN